MPQSAAQTLLTWLRERGDAAHVAALEALLDDHTALARAKAAGCEALVLTLDLQVLAQRHKDIRNGLSAPPKPTIKSILNVVIVIDLVQKVESLDHCAGVIADDGQDLLFSQFVSGHHLENELHCCLSCVLSSTVHHSERSGEW